MKTYTLNFTVREWAINAMLFVALIIAGCKLGTVTAAQQIAAGCAASSAALKSLTIANDAGKLTTEQQTAIIHADGYIRPICTADEQPTLDTIRLEAFNRAIAILTAEAAKL